MAKETLGKLTGAALDHVAPLLLPWLPDPWGVLRPALSVEAMRLSAELAADTYAMHIDPWLQAGWQDVTIQVDGDLTDGVEQDAQGANPMDKILSALKLKLVQTRLKPRGPFGQMTGALRQLDGSDTGKALVMIHPTEDGRYVVAISFMGTGEQLYDWVSNFRMSSEGGMHRGFVQLTEQFEDNECDVLFPETAQALGLEKLTLRHILEEMRHPNSRFILWLTGHSQGAALMQIYCRHKIERDGVLPRHIVGYGFASPSVATGDSAAAPGSYPLYHIINADDIVPRVGAMVHLGLLLLCYPDETMRQACYGWPMDEDSLRHRALVQPLVNYMQDTPRCIETGLAYLNLLAEQSADDIAASLGAVGLHPAMMKVANAADHGVDRVLRYVARRLSAAYLSIAGENVDRSRVADIQSAIAAVMEEIGVRAFAETLADFLGAPHMLDPRRKGIIPSYVYIVREMAETLQPMQWLKGTPPRMLKAGAAPMVADSLLNRRRLPALRKTRTGRSISQQRGRTDTRHHAAVPVQGSLRTGETMVLHK